MSEKIQRSYPEIEPKIIGKGSRDRTQERLQKKIGSYVQEHRRALWTGLGASALVILGTGFFLAGKYVHAHIKQEKQRSKIEEMQRKQEEEFQKYCLSLGIEHHMLLESHQRFLDEQERIQKAISVLDDILFDNIPSSIAIEDTRDLLGSEFQNKQIAASKRDKLSDQLREMQQIGDPEYTGLLKQFKQNDRVTIKYHFYPSLKAYFQDYPEILSTHEEMQAIKKQLTRLPKSDDFYTTAERERLENDLLYLQNTGREEKYQEVTSYFHNSKSSMGAITIPSSQNGKLIPHNRSIAHKPVLRTPQKRPSSR